MVDDARFQRFERPLPGLAFELARTPVTSATSRPTLGSSHRYAGNSGLRLHAVMEKQPNAWGGWSNDADYARSACRVGIHPSFRGGFLGFRPARVIPGDFTTSPTPS